MKNPSQGDIKVTEGTLAVTLVFEDRLVQIDTEDIIDMYFIEDIFKFSMTGKLIFYDKYNFLELGPFTGSEQISVIYGINRDVHLIFDIWKVNEISMTQTMDSSSFSMIELFIVDPLFQQLNFRKYSRSWSGDVKSSYIVNDILKKMTTLGNINNPPINLEESEDKITNFIMPYWSPQQSIMFLMERAVGSKSKNSGYLCYNNTYNYKMTTNFLTLDYLLNDEGSNIDPDIYRFRGRDISESNKILEWSISGNDKLATEYLRGGVSRGYNWETKTLHNREQKYSDLADKMVMLGNKTLFPDVSDTFSKQINYGESESDVIDNIFYSGWSRRYVLQNTVNLVLYGHEKRFAGQQIDIEWPSSVESTSSFSGFNKSWKGGYMIKSITHSFIGSQVQKEAYLQKVVLIKNAYTDPEEDILYKSSKIKTSNTSNTIIKT